MELYYLEMFGFRENYEGIYPNPLINNLGNISCIELRDYWCVEEI